MKAYRDADVTTMVDLLCALADQVELFRVDDIEMSVALQGYADDLRTIADALERRDVMPEMRNAANHPAIRDLMAQLTLERFGQQGRTDN